MKNNLPQCEMMEEFGSSSCSEWCYGVPDAEQPNHVCYSTFVGSIVHYIAAHLALTDFEYGHTLSWPASMGVQELRKWHEEQTARYERNLEFPDISPEFNKRWDEIFPALPPKQDDERLVLFSDYPPEKVEAYRRRKVDTMESPQPFPPVWGAPPVTVPGGEYWLGFVVRRPVNNSKLWLLGLLGRPKPGEFTGHNWYVWIHPVLQIESRAVSASEMDVVNKQSKILLKWYNKLVLGKLSQKGRPIGSKEYWLCRDDFLATVRAAVRAIEKRGDNVRQKELAEYLWSQRTRVTRPLSEGADPVTQFKRDRKDYGFPTWADLKEFLEI